MARKSYSPDGHPPTLGELCAERVEYIRTWCNRCSRYLEVPMDPIIEQTGSDLLFPRLAGRLRCTACGARDARIMPLWPSRDAPSSRTPDAPSQNDDDENGPGDQH